MLKERRATQKGRLNKEELEHVDEDLEDDDTEECEPNISLVREGCI